MNWLDTSTICFGLILANELPKSQFRPELFHAPYDDGFKLLQDDEDRSKIVNAVGLDFYRSAHQSVENFNGEVKEVDFGKMLEEKAEYYLAGEKLQYISRQLQRGDEPQWAEISDIVTKAQIGSGQRFTPMGDIKAVDFPVKKCGVRPIDYHLGGLPEVGMTLLAGRPKVGKTTLMLEFAEKWVETHKDDVVAIFTLEMLKEQLKKRFGQISNGTSKDKINRILVCDEPVGPHQIVSWSAGIENLGLLIVDFADLMSDKEVTEQIMTMIYRTLAQGAKKLRCSVLLLAQLSGGYQGGIPRPHHVRYSRLTEALASLHLMLHNPTTNFYENYNDKSKDLPVIDGRGYIVCWLSRWGTPHGDEFPGAIQIPFSGRTGWDLRKTGRWHYLGDIDQK